MKRKWILTSLIVAILLCLCNIVFACVWHTQATNIFTALSGWISGIATAVLGGIAVWQNKKYKEQNDKNSLISLRELKYTNLREIYKQFIMNFSSEELFHKGYHLYLIDDNDTDGLLKSVAERKNFFECKIAEMICILRDINSDKIFYQSKEELLKSINYLMDYIFIVRDYYSEIKKFLNPEHIKKTTQLQYDYKLILDNVLDNFDQYLTEVEEHIEILINETNYDTIRNDMKLRKQKHIELIASVSSEVFNRLDKEQK